MQFLYMYMYTCMIMYIFMKFDLYLFYMSNISV